jgi:hypothetical protein
MPNLLQYLSTHIPHLIVGALLTFPAYKVGRWTLEKAGGWLWELTLGAIQADKQWKSEVKQELVLQRTNCLSTLQAQGKVHIELLEKLSTEQQQTNLLLAEQSGYLKGIMERK